MKMNKYLTLSLLAAGLSVSAAGFAGTDNGATDHKSDSQAVFKKLDANGDGKLSAAEMTRLPDVMKQQMLDKIDTNHDGKIEKSEFEAQAKARADRLFAKMDTNGDGSISADEMKMPHGHHHMSPPKDHMASSQAGDQDDAPKQPNGDVGGKRGDHDHHRWGNHHGHHGHHGKPTTDEIFAHMDRNNDGYVSADEWNQAAQQWHHHHGHHKPMADQDQNPGADE